MMCPKKNLHLGLSVVFQGFHASTMVLRNRCTSLTWVGDTHLLSVEGTLPGKHLIACQR